MTGLAGQLRAWLGPPQGQTAPADLLARQIDTPLGAMICVTDADRLHLLEFAERPELPAEMRRLAKSAKTRIAPGRNALADLTETQLAAYFAGQSCAFDLPLALSGTDFQRLVWRELIRIPAGQTVSYSELAARIGRPDAVRAVAAANGANRLAVIVPCHRVLGADGSLTGYAGGLWRKKALIDHESAAFARPAT
ncbi:MAG: methylated-DNA--[protein]-cysteine S-methyltransferase [Paracoccus sp. (in: a-proteobacteria)]